MDFRFYPSTRLLKLKNLKNYQENQSGTLLGKKNFIFDAWFEK